MTDDQLLRYSRHILLDDIGIEGQQRLLDARVLVIGAGGLGSPVALYLGASGVGTITLIDDDRVDLTNLQRQIAHTEDRIGWNKVESIAVAVKALNPAARVVGRFERADAVCLEALVPLHDVVVDCSDNFATRHAVNAACVKHARPLVAGAAIGFDGQLAVWDTRGHAHPCYACVFPASENFEEARCATLGVFAPLVGIIGSLQAAEVLKLVVGIGESLAGRLQLLDARTMTWTELKARRLPDCPVCRHRLAPADAGLRSAATVTHF